MALLSKVLKVVCWAGSVFVPNMLLASEDIKQKQNERQRLRDCPAQQLKEQLRSAQVAGQWRGDTALTLPLFWRRSTVSGLFRAVSAVEPFILSPPSHSVPVPNRPTRLCGRKATLNQPTGSVPFPPVSLQRQVVCLLLRPVFISACK